MSNDKIELAKGLVLPTGPQVATSISIDEPEVLGPSAKIICDSISSQGHRLTTMEVRMHRFILAEMNTHRAFSRNSASSRAIPSSRVRGMVYSNIAYPIHWGAEQKGMQSGPDTLDTRMMAHLWHNASDDACRTHSELEQLGLHKSLCNRLLEPFMWHTAVITATEWDNFFYQRCSPAAQPEMKAVADAMQLAYYTSTPNELAHGEWHTPYISMKDLGAIEEMMHEEGRHIQVSDANRTACIKEVSVARCARVSYLTQNGVRDVREDIKLYNRLADSGHWSPFEHVARPVTNGTNSNFIGWHQFRKDFRNENWAKFIPNLPALEGVAATMREDEEKHNGKGRP